MNVKLTMKNGQPVTVRIADELRELPESCRAPGHGTTAKPPDQAGKAKAA